MIKTPKVNPNKSVLLQYFLLVLPGLIIFTIGVILPIILSLVYSFTSWNGMSAKKDFIGLKNYIDLFKDRNFIDAWKFTIKFTIANTIIQNALALLFAILLDSGIKGQKWYRAILFIPCLVSPVVAGFIWLRMFSNVLPEINNIFGTNINFLLFGDSKTVLSGLLTANNWQWVGYWMLVYLAGLQSVPKELYEAAEIDGAGPLSRIKNITLPMLAPSFTICIVGITTGSLKVYDLLVSSTRGGPGRASTSIIYEIYTTAINGRQYGYGSAMSISLIIVLLLVALVQVKNLKKKEVQA